MATHKTFTISSAVNFGWETIKSRFVFFAGIALLVWGVNLLLSSIGDPLQEDHQLIWLIIILLTWFIEWGLTLGWYTINLKTVAGHKAKFDDLFSKFELMLMLRYFVSSLLFALAVLAGFILFIVPGIIISVRLGFYVYLLLDKDMGPVEALKASWHLTNGHTWQLLLLGIVLFGINLLGLLFFFIGLVVTAPLSLLATTYVYHKLSAK